ncbi:MAG: phosphomannomutase/phosphoglucomutase, partial [Clostridiales bacterium]|nr:phosphomannomutase/phosphoglucomutase [Clostridiales bacterium]
MYKHLQNGSDIRGVAIKTADKEITLTSEIVKRIGAALVKHLEKKLGKSDLKIALGHDSRLSATDMFLCIASGIEHKGAKAVYTGLSSTPAMFFSTILDKHNYDAGVMITASHLPYERNGFKFFTKEGGFEKDDIKTILKYAEEFDGAGIPTKAMSDFEQSDIMGDYAKELQKIIKDKAGLGEKPLTDLHIIIDAGNGAGGYFEKLVLQPLGAKTTGSLFTEPDGTFPNHSPNPEDS